MLSFDIRSLETKAVHVDGSIQPDDPIWEDGDVRPTSCTVCVPSSSCRASRAPAIAALGAKSPPIASNAIRANLRFLRFYSLFAIVVSALGADMMRTSHALAAGTLLNDDRRRDFVRVAGALLPLRGASLRDGHCICSLGSVTG